MNINFGTQTTLERRHVSTDEFAARLLVLRQTVLKSYSRDGAYCGIRPVRLPNRRLAWPLDDVETLFNSGAADTSIKGAV